MEVNVQNSSIPIPLGRRGENMARTIVFDLSGFVTDYGAGNAILLHQRHGSREVYCVDAEADEAQRQLRWKPTCTDTAVAGLGNAELRWYCGDILAKSIVYRTSVEEALQEPAEVPPELPESWYENVLKLGVMAEEYAQTAADAAESAEKSAQRAEAASGTAMGFEIGNGLKWDEGNVLAVDTADAAEQDNTLPITSAAVYTEVGNIGALLATI